MCPIRGRRGRVSHTAASDHKARADPWLSSHADPAALAQAGIKAEGGGVHQSKTMMLGDLSALLECRASAAQHRTVPATHRGWPRTRIADLPRATADITHDGISRDGRIGEDKADGRLSDRRVGDLSRHQAQTFLLHGMQGREETRSAIVPRG